MVLVPAILAAGVSAYVAIRTERYRQEAAERSSYIQELRNRTAQVFSALYSIEHLVAWIVWYATYDPDSVDDAKVARYDQELLGAELRARGALATVAAMSVDLYDRLCPIANDVADLEGRVTLALRKLYVDRASSMTKLGEYHERAEAMHRQLPIDLGRVMQEVEDKHRMPR